MMYYYYRPYNINSIYITSTEVYISKNCTKNTQKHPGIKFIYMIFTSQKNKICTTLKEDPDL